jgi:HK97 family phage major capsid protein
MAEMKNIQEYLGTGAGTEGSLLIPSKIYDTLIAEVDKALIPRSEAKFVVGPSGIPGSSIDINTQTADTLDVRAVAEGGEIPIDQATYANTNVKPVKYGVSVRITRELTEDSKFNLLADQIRLAGRRFAENENSLVVTELDNASNTVAGGAAITIANITRAMQHLDDADYQGTTFVVGMEVLNDLRNIDTFVEANKLGSTEMLTTGFVGNIYGLNVIKVSTNAGMTTTSSYVFDKNEAYVIVEKRPITIENFDLPSNDMSAAAITQRLAVSSIRNDAIAKITTS